MLYTETYYNYGDNNTIKTGNGKDYVESYGQNLTIHQGTGLADQFIDMGSISADSTQTPVDNSIIRISIEDGQTAEADFSSIIAGGAKFSITNISGERKLFVGRIDPATGEYTFNTNELEIAVSDYNGAESLTANIVGNGNTYTGGDKQDTVNIKSGNYNTINGGAGNDTLRSESLFNILNGDDGSDILTANSDGNELNGGADGDTIVANSDFNVIDAGDGANNITINGSSNTVTSGDDSDTVVVNGYENTVNTNAGDDNITLNGSQNYAFGGAGADSITSNLENNFIFGEDGDDKIVLNSNYNEVEAGAGNDNISVNGEENFVQGQEGNDSITVSGLNNILWGGDDNDTITAYGDNNTIAGENGDDIIATKGEGTCVFGDAGNDKVTINGRNNEVFGGDGDDTVTIAKFSQNNIVDGEAGNNKTIDYGRSSNITNSEVQTVTGNEIRIELDGHTSISVDTSLVLGGFNVDLTSREKALESIANIDLMLEEINTKNTEIATQIGVMQSISMNQLIKIENLSNAKSTIHDTDIAQETAGLVRAQILQEVSTSLLTSTKDINRDIVMSLLD